MRSKEKLNIYRDKDALAASLARDIFSYLELLTGTKEQVDIALSGGNTPLLLYREMVILNPNIDWKKMRFFWVDDRCVPADHPESNFGNAYLALLEPLKIPETSYYRIQGEKVPEEEAERYGDLIQDLVSPEMSFPVFDLILLGIGSDGHVASIFPHQIEKWNEESLCTVGTHPDSGQQRVSFTGHLINAAGKVIILATGKNKAGIIEEVVSRKGNYEHYPASLVNPVNSDLEWYLDRDAASQL
ncbi:6-phosphogluconolactonase [Bacteroidota bacterium]